MHNYSSSVRYILILAVVAYVSVAAVLSESTPIYGTTEQESVTVTPPLRGLIMKESISESNSNSESELSRRRKPTPRIIGGQTLNDPDRFPYFALMNGSGQCGAALISKRFVLTAAHCVGTDNDFEIGISERLPFLEAAFLTNSDSGGTEYRYSNGIVHPDYNDYSVSNDIALYELAQDVVPTNTNTDPDTDININSIPYIRLEQTPVTTKGTPMTVIGFGDIDPSNANDVLSDELLEATVGFVPRAECIARMGLGQIGPDMLCAYNPSGEDSCGGDSGGPLVLKGGTSGNGNGNGNPADDSLVGLVSWGYDCGGNTPGVYTNIAYFYDWIVESMCAMNPSAVPDYVVCSSNGNIGGSSSSSNDNIGGSSSSSSTVAGGSGESNEGSIGSGSGSGSGSIPTPPETQVPTSAFNFDDDDDYYSYNDDELFQEVADWFQEAVDWIESF